MQPTITNIINIINSSDKFPSKVCKEWPLKIRKRNISNSFTEDRQMQPTFANIINTIIIIIMVNSLFEFPNKVCKK